MTIWKYTFRPADSFHLQMPVGAKVLCVQTQGDVPCIWALVDPEAPQEIRRFRMAGTGHTLPDDPGQYVGTFQLRGGLLVFHLFAAQADDGEGGV